MTVALVLVQGGCAAGRRAAGTTPAFDEVRIAALQTEGGYTFERMGARGLFYEALDRAQSGRDDDAARLFDRVVDQFPGSRYMPPALFDSAVCHDRLGRHAQAAARYERLIRQVPGSAGTERARLALADVYARMGRFERSRAHLDTLLAATDLKPSLRLEALVQRARLLLTMERFPEAEVLAAEALAYAPAPTADDDRATIAALHAEASFVEAETYRMRAAAVPLTPSGETPRRERLAERGRLRLEAQRLYFETLRRGEPRWAEEAGARLGVLYRDLWNELPAPVGVLTATSPPMTPVDADEAEAPMALTAEVEALVRVGLRNADLALRQMERLDQVPSSFTERVRAELAQARAQLEPGNAAASEDASAPRDL
jgi:tetratricopeptide (TPR) repeat protein